MFASNQSYNKKGHRLGLFTPPMALGTQFLLA